MRVGDHLHRRRSRHPPLPRDPHRGARVGTDPFVPRDVVPAHLRRAPQHRAARRVPLRDPQAHAAPRGREALLRRVPEGRAPDGHAVGGGQRAVDLLPGQQRPPRSRAGPALDHPPHGEAAHDRRVLVQEVDRPAVPLPRQLARPHRELPHDDVRGAVGALRGEPRPSCTRSSSSSSCTPTTSRTARRRRCAWSGSSEANLFASIAAGINALWGPLHGGANQAVIEMLEAHPRRRRRHRTSTCRWPRTRRPVPALGLRAPRLQELRPARPHPQGGVPPRDRRAGHAWTSCSTSRCDSRRSR